MNGIPIVLGYLLDIAFRDPAVGFHPVRLVGIFIQAQERLYRKVFGNLLFAGFILSAVTVSTVLAASYGFVVVAAGLHPAAGFLASAILVYISISPASLAHEAMKIHGLLSAGDDEGAKRELSLIVGRDTHDMTREEIARACVETVAENSVDGLISPLFFAAIGGGPLAMAYRAVNTCDSMVGYRNERYELFGKVSARLDDAANFIPARLSIAVVFLASLALRMDGRRALEVALRDRLKHPSPNSAHAEAAFAGAMGVQLGGISSYGGVRKEKPCLGDPVHRLGAERIPSAVRLLRVASAIACALFAFASLWR